MPPPIPAQVVFPALRKLTATQQAQHGGAGPGSAQQAEQAQQAGQLSAEMRHRCEADHAEESSKFEELGRLLGDVKACARCGVLRCAGGCAALGGSHQRLRGWAGYCLPHR